MLMIIHIFIVIRMRLLLIMISHNKPTISKDDKKAISNVLSSGWLAQGKEVKLFEDELCEFFNIPSGHALAVSSGSSALYLALWVLNAKNKNIGSSVYACAALRNAIGLAGGVPYYFDCGKNSPNIEIRYIKKNLIDILIAPSIFGIPTGIPNKKEFKIIEDIAQSFGAISCGKRIGLRGDIGICSFYATKMITSGGQGGAIISKDKTLIDELRDYRQFDCREDSKIRFNFQMTDTQASMGRTQLLNISEYIKKREKIFQIYKSYGLNLIDTNYKDDIPVRYRAVIKCNSPKELIKELESKNIQAIVPVEEWELLDKTKNYPNALKLSTEAVSLPIYPTLKENDAKIIGKIAKNFS